MDRRKFPGTPEEVLPFDALETPVAGPEAQEVLGDPEMSLDDLAVAVAERRRSALVLRPTQAAPVPDGDERKHPMRGGAFGGALKRRILLTDSERMKSYTNESDIALVTPENIRPKLFPYQRVEQSYGGVLFPAAEYMAVTVSAPELARRLGAQVMANTPERLPSERHQRRAKVVSQSLERRDAVVQGELDRLTTVSDKLGRLRKEIKTPGYSHMTLDDMNDLMANAETVFISMLETIVESDDNLDDDRVYSLTGALLYNLTSDDYKKTFGLWSGMTNLGFTWTNQKIVKLVKVQQGIERRISNSATVR